MPYTEGITRDIAYSTYFARAPSTLVVSLSTLALSAMPVQRCTAMATHVCLVLQCTTTSCCTGTSPKHVGRGCAVVSTETDVSVCRNRHDACLCTSDWNGTEMEWNGMEWRCGVARQMTCVVVTLATTSEESTPSSNVSLKLD